MRRVNMAKRVFAMGLATALTVTSVISPKNVVAVRAADDNEGAAERTEMQLPITLYDINKDNMFFEYDNNLFYLFSFVAGNIFQPYAKDMGLSYIDEDWYTNKTDPDEGYIWGDWLNIKEPTFGIPSLGGNNSTFWIRKGLVENTLGADKVPKYTQQAVEYMAKAVQLVLNQDYEQYGIQGDDLTYSGGQDKKDGIFRKTSDAPSTSIYSNPTIQYLMNQIGHTASKEELLVNGNFAGATGESFDGTFDAGAWKYNAKDDVYTHAKIWEGAYVGGTNAVVVGFDRLNQAATDEEIKKDGYLYQEFTVSENISQIELSMDTMSYTRPGRNMMIVDADGTMAWSDRVKYYGRTPDNTGGWQHYVNTITANLQKGHTYELRIYSDNGSTHTPGEALEVIFTNISMKYEPKQAPQNLLLNGSFNGVTGDTRNNNFAVDGWTWNANGSTSTYVRTYSGDDRTLINIGFNGNDENVTDYKSAAPYGYIYTEFTPTKDITNWTLSYDTKSWSNPGRGIEISGTENDVYVGKYWGHSKDAGGNDWVHEEINSSDIEGTDTTLYAGNTYRLYIKADSENMTDYNNGLGDASFANISLTYPEATYSYDLGTYEDSVGKQAGDVTTCMDYAYQMMNHFWSPYTLNNRELVTKTDLYDTITLKKIEGVNTLSDQYNGYSFLGNFDFANKVDAKENYDIVYDLTNRTIKNADALTGENHQQDGLFPLDAPYYTGGEVTTGKIQNTSNQELLQDHNYHYAIKSNGKFVYNESSNLYFTFTGDDDVYLYINNHLVMDIGGAHRAYTETVNINEIAEACGLKDGNVYDFDFFYLERHTDYANLKINTNIEVVEPEATVSKTAYESNGREIPDGTSVPK